jgi:hypothetical protein
VELVGALVYILQWCSVLCVVSSCLDFEISVPCSDLNGESEDATKVVF